MASDSELGWSDYLEIIPNKYKYKYKDEPDNFKISVGDWKSDSDGSVSYTHLTLPTIYSV